MESTDRKGGLRLARMAGESVLRERILPEERLDEGLVEAIGVQLKNIIEEMEAEWKSNPASDELREAFHLLKNYADCLGRIRQLP